MAHADAVLWPGLNMLDRDGDKIGRIEDVFIDPESKQPEWALVNTGLFGVRSTFVPLEGATEDRQAVLVPYPKKLVQEAPSFERDHGLSAEDESGIYRHYGVDSGATAVGSPGRPPEAPSAHGGSSRFPGDEGVARQERRYASHPGPEGSEGRPTPPVDSPGAADASATAEPTVPAAAHGPGEGSTPGATPAGAGTKTHTGSPTPAGAPPHDASRPPERDEGGDDRGVRGHEGRERTDRSPLTAGRVLVGLRDRIDGVLERYSAREEHDRRSDANPATHPAGTGDGAARSPAEPTTQRPASDSHEEDSPLREGDEIGRRRGADGRMRRYVVTEVIEEPGDRPG